MLEFWCKNLKSFNILRSSRNWKSEKFSWICDLEIDWISEWVNMYLKEEMEKRISRVGILWILEISFFGKMKRKLFVFMGFLSVFVFEEKLWVSGFARDWISSWVYGFISSIYLWFGLVSWIYFLFFYIWWSRFGCWIWIWDLLEIGLFHGFRKNMKNNFSSYEKIMKVKKKF